MGKPKGQKVGFEQLRIGTNQTWEGGLNSTRFGAILVRFGGRQEVVYPKTHKVKN